MENLNNVEHENTRQSFEKLSNDTGKMVGSFSSNLKKSAEDYTRIGKAYIEDNPNKSLVISAMAGAVVGSLITLVTRRNK